MNNKNFSLSKIILAVLWQKGAIGKDAILRHRYFRLLACDKSKNTHRSCIHRLLSSGTVRKDINNILVLTEQGGRRAVFAFIETELAIHKGAESLEESKKWDGGWRIVFFDIPEKNRTYRDYLRKILKLIGFHELQKSIWVYPHPVPSFLKNLILHKDIKECVRFITTDRIDNDHALRHFFNLS